MTDADLYLLTGVALFALGAVYLVLHPQLIGKILAINIAGSGVFLVFIVIAAGAGNGSPDPVPHAMVLTGIVVAVSATAVALAFVSRLHSDDARGGNQEKQNKT
ncbi:MAG: NADH-quinone oxidoreductase subunit K [Gammaproteobacteria bacterium]|jgi:multicomponent Na+:H+ antiporter subunit C